MGLKGDGYMNYTYILKCRDNSLYTGWTNDIDKRIKAHNDGKGAKYTKSRRPVELIYYEKYADEGRSDETGICHQAYDPQGKRRIIKKWPCRKGDEVGH